MTKPPGFDRHLPIATQWDIPVEISGWPDGVNSVGTIMAYPLTGIGIIEINYSDAAGDDAFLQLSVESAQTLIEQLRRAIELAGGK